MRRDPLRVLDRLTQGGGIKSRWVCPDCGTWLFGSPRPGTSYPGMTRVARSRQLREGATVFETQPSR